MRKECRLTIGVAAMGNAIDHDTPTLIINRVERAIGSNSQAIGVGVACEFFRVQGSRVDRETLNDISDPEGHIVGQVMELTSCSRGIEDLIQGSHPSLQRRVGFRHRDELVVPVSLEVGDVF